MTLTKRCPRCDLTKPIADFYLNKGRADGLSGYCVLCQRAAEATRKASLRGAVVGALGGHCVRCGYDRDPRAFQVDHVEAGGRVERTALGSNTQFLRKVLADVAAGLGTYQLLCANCNQIKRIENEEFAPDGHYSRVVPTAVSEGYRAKADGQSPEHRQHVSEGLRRVAAENPEAWADRNRRIAEGNRKPKKNSRTAEMAATALRLRAEGATQAVIAKELGVSQPRVSALLKGAASPA